MKDCTRIAILVFATVIGSGCDLVGFFSLRATYNITGVVKNAADHQIISFVRVTVSCQKSKPDPPLETSSNSDGHFRLFGNYVGDMDDCQLTFDHPKFRQKTLRLTEDQPRFFKKWELEVELEPL
jgi:hypothetical protein